MNDKEEWSLKGKEYDVLMSDYDVELTTVYKKDDIETLRQKLIEDFKKIEKEWEEVEGINPNIPFEEIINKRFGVKE